MMKKYLLFILIYGLFTPQSVQAEAFCFFGCTGDFSLFGDIALKMPSSGETNEMGKQLIKGVRSELDDMDLGKYGKELATGVQTVFNDTMKQLFEQRINPMIEDVNKLIHVRANEINKMSADRLKQLDELISQNLQAMDRIILETLTQFEKIAHQLVAEVKKEWLKYGFDRLDHSLDRTDLVIKKSFDELKINITALDTLLTKNIERTDEAIQSAFTRLDQSIDNTKSQLVEPSLKTLFQGLQETIDQAQKQIIDRGLDKSREVSKQLMVDINTTIDNIKLKILKEAAQEGQVFLEAVQQKIIIEAEQSARALLTQVKEEVILETSQQVESLRARFRKDVDHYFDRTEYLINLVDCQVVGHLEQIRLNISQLSDSFSKEVRGWLPWLKKKKRSVEIQFCYAQLGLTEDPKHFEYATIYEIHKCHLLNQIKPTTPVTRIKTMYLDLQNYAAQMRCLQRGAAESASRHYTWDWIEFANQYHFWASMPQQ